MKLSQPQASLFVPDGASEVDACSRVTHLGVGAHQDDLEFMAYHGIASCYRHSDRWFGGVVATDGGGSPRAGRFAEMTDDQMKVVRAQEQQQAATLGEYGVMIQTQYSSRQLKDPAHNGFRDDLIGILEATQPSVVYTHNPADKHATHVCVALATLEAIRQLPMDRRPTSLWAGEVWRSLDWLNDDDKVALNVSAHGELALGLAQIFESQISGGKQYDQAVLGRRRANATFHQSHATDDATSLEFAMDLTPLVRDDSIDIVEYVQAHIRRFADNVLSTLRQYR